MSIDAYLVINGDGYRMATPDLSYAQRVAAHVHGIWRHLIDEEHAQELERAAFQRGFAEGRAAGTLQCQQAACETSPACAQSSSDSPGVESITAS